MYTNGLITSVKGQKYNRGRNYQSSYPGLMETFKKINLIAN